MPIVELDEPIGHSADDTFAPHANQKLFASRWAIKEGQAGAALGFKSMRDLQQRQPFGHGSRRALSGWEPFQEGKKMHEISFNGVKLVEMIAPREDVELMDQWQGIASRNRIDALKADELAKLDRMGLSEGRDPDNMRERIVQDDTELPTP